MLLDIALIVLVWLGLFAFAAFLSIKRDQLLQRRRQQRIELQEYQPLRRFPDRSRRGT